MFLKINFESETPIYTQIRQQIIEGIASGGLKHGESLPSVRQLAADLGVNMHTVNKAYALLKQDGFVVIHKREGVLVASMDQMTGKKISNTLRNQMGFLIAEMICRGNDQDAMVKEVKSIYQNLKGGKEHV
jgi:DNA-binding transcriptional regulator YhcF (GntR family)